MTTKFFRRRNRDRAPNSGGSSRNVANNNPRGRGRGETAADPTPVTAAVPILPAPLVCHTCRGGIERSERHIHTSRAISGERRYHRECFLCLHCNAPIDPQGQSFCYAKLSGRDGGGGNNNSSSIHGGSGHDSPRDDDERPFHRECFAAHFGWMCVVCEKPLPMVTRSNDGDADRIPEDGARGDDRGNGGSSRNRGGGHRGGKSTKVEFLKHPFFDNERMCPHHAGPGAIAPSDPAGSTRSTARAGDHAGGRNSVNTTTSEEVMGEVRRCAGCHRFEPLFASSAKHFIDVGDSDTGRCVCLACCRTVVTSSDDVIPLWDKVIDFFEGPLGLITSEDSENVTMTGSTYHNKRAGVTRQDLKSIPIMIVGMEALNDNMRRGSAAHFGSLQIMTRGLCLSEHTGGHDGEGCEVGVTAILCLSGLPSDLTASILAHEATHAWIKLHPNFPYMDPLPLKVEEGLCQLVAFLFLNDGLDPTGRASTSSHQRYPAEDGGAADEDEDDGSIPSDEKLRQYFRFCIETDEGVYGEGFRLAARAYAMMGMQELLYHVALHRDFPEL